MDVRQRPQKLLGKLPPELAADRPAARRLEAGSIPWAAVLPVRPEGPLLAAGLGVDGLLRLARFWRCIHVHDRHEMGARALAEQAGALAPDCRFVPVAADQAGCYEAMAVGPGLLGLGRPARALRLLRPGGGVAWVGWWFQTPRRLTAAREGFATARSYAVLPPCRPKLVVPLLNRQASRAGLSLYAPGKWQNRLAVRAAWLTASVGLQDALGHRRMVVARKRGAASKDAFLLDVLSSKLARKLAEVAVYVGPQKLTLLLLDEHYEPCGVAKLAETPAADSALAHGAGVLRHLAGISALRGSVPAVLGSVEWMGRQVIVQSGADARLRGYSAVLTAAHMRFLAAMAVTDRCDGRLRDWPRWTDVLRWAQGEHFASAGQAEATRAAVRRCGDLLAEVTIPFHRVHGDFAPWNTVLCADRLTVVDWDASEARGLPLFDLVHFVVRVDTLVRRRPLPLRELVAGPVAALGVDREVRALADALSLAGSLGYTGEQIETLVRLCLLIEAMDRGADS